MSDIELCYLSATQALRRFASGALSPRELIHALIARAESVEPSINAFADRYFDEALELAMEAERRYARGTARRLEGLPLAVKDDGAIRGKRNTSGSLVHRDHVADHTDPHIERLQRAGAIVHARTTCPEFCAAWVTYSRLHGVSRCPWNTAYTPGGSSGGSAAAVAAGTTTLATGSDNAGSIRQPASICGVVGYKPPHGRNPAPTPLNLDPAMAVGPLTRSVADSALMQNVMSGPHRSDITASRQRVRLALEPRSVRGRKIAYSPDLDYVAVDAQVRRNLDAVVQALRDDGAEVEPVRLGWTRRVHEVALEHYTLYYAAAALAVYERHRELLTDYSLYYATRKRDHDARDYGRVVEMAAQMYETLGPVLSRYHAFICPTVAVPSIPATMGPQETLRIEGREVDADFGWTLTYPFNLLGPLPVLAVPSGVADNGVPTGVQIVARPFDDARVFEVGAALERARPWDYRRLAGLGAAH